MLDANKIFSAIDDNKAICPCSAQWIMVPLCYAAYLPESPDNDVQAHAKIFFSYFPDQCIDEPFNRCYRNYSDSNPPPVHDRKKLMYWLQIAENECRRKAGVPERVFSFKRLMRRWRYPDGYI